MFHLTTLHGQSLRCAAIQRVNAKLPSHFLSLSLTTQVLLLLAVFLTRPASRAAEPPAAQWSSDDHKNLTLRRHRTCVENEQYLYQGLCCLNCQAGKETGCSNHDNHVCRKYLLPNLQLFLFFYQCFNRFIFQVQTQYTGSSHTSTYEAAHMLVLPEQKENKINK